jgi:hypothetical protein
MKEGEISATAQGRKIVYCIYHEEKREDEASTPYAGF